MPTVDPLPFGMRRRDRLPILDEAINVARFVLLEFEIDRPVRRHGHPRLSDSVLSGFETGVLTPFRTLT